MSAGRIAEIGIVCTLVSVSIMGCAFVLDRILKPWRERKIAEARERQAVADLSSERMQAAFQVLIGQESEGTPGLGKRVANIEAQLKNNGGNSMRDVLDKIHAVAVENAEANARVEQGQQRAAALAGEAATLASTADDRIKALGEQQRDQHSENVGAIGDLSRRVGHLEMAADNERMRRQFYLEALREVAGIDLPNPPDD